MKQDYNSISSENIEKAILHFILESNEKREEILSKIREEDFLDSKNQFIFKKIKELFLINKNTLDLNLLAQKLELDGDIKKIGGWIYLTEIVDIYVPTSMMEMYVEALIKNSTKRKIELELNSLISETKKSSNFDTLISKLREKLNDIEDFFNRNFKKFIPLSKIVKTFFKEAKDYSEQHINGFKTGFSKLDTKLKGFQNGDLIILAARPSMGKTTLALNFISPIVDQKNEDGDVIFFSLEMSSEQLAKKIIRSRTDFFSMFKEEFNQNLKLNFIEELKNKKIFIDSSSSINVSEIGFKLRDWKRRRKISLIVIDYLQLLSSIKGQQNYNNRNLEVSNWTRQLKEIAREINVPILCLSQLSRGVEKREDKHPLLSDLRDSGSIEQDADVVMFLYREYYYIKKTVDNIKDYNLIPHNAEINIAKHRNGPTGKIDIMFFPEKQTFMEFSEDDN